MQSKCSAFTHVEASDLWVVLSELLEPDREALHETAALVVAHRAAPGSAEEWQEDEAGQEERPRSHAGGQAVEVFWLETREEWALGSADAAGSMDSVDRDEVFWLARGEIFLLWSCRGAQER